MPKLVLPAVTRGFSAFCALLASLTVLCASQQPEVSAAPAMISASIPADRMEQYSDLAVRWMQEYLRVDTTNPPGNELRGASFLKNILDHEAIENRVFEYAPGRADLWARLPHTSAKPKRPLILLNHT